MVCRIQFHTEIFSIWALSPAIDTFGFLWETVILSLSCQTSQKQVEKLKTTLIQTTCLSSVSFQIYGTQTSLFFHDINSPEISHCVTCEDQSFVMWRIMYTSLIQIYTYTLFWFYALLESKMTSDANPAVTVGSNKVVLNRSMLFGLRYMFFFWISLHL